VVLVIGDIAALVSLSVDLAASQFMVLAVVGQLSVSYNICSCTDSFSDVNIQTTIPLSIIIRAAIQKDDEENWPAKPRDFPVLVFNLGASDSSTPDKTMAFGDSEKRIESGLERQEEVITIKGQTQV
jgi:hypothetical protein